MDQKNLSNLDPKLRETYERVMGTPTPSSDFYTSASPVADQGQPTPPPAPSNTQAQATQPPAEPVTSPPPAGDGLSAPIPPQTSPAQNPPVANPASYMPEAQAAQTMNPYATPFPSPASVAQQHEVSPIIRVLYIIGAAVFFLAYTFFWIRVFNLELPF